MVSLLRVEANDRRRGAAAQRPTRPPVNTAAHGAARAPGLHSPRTGQPPASPLRSVSHTPGGATPQSHPPTSLTAPRNVAHPVAARMLFKRNPGCDATWRYNGVDYPCQLQDAGSGGAQVCIALDANGDIIFVFEETRRWEFSRRDGSSSCRRVTRLRCCDANDGLCVH